MRAESNVSKKPLSRRVLLSAGAGLGLTGIAGAQTLSEETIGARDVANGLNCCLGVVDLILLLEIKPDLREVAATGREVLRFLPALADRTAALDKRGGNDSLRGETQSLIRSTAASTTALVESVRGVAVLIDEFLANGVADGQTAESIRLFVAKVLAVGLLMNQTADSLLSLRFSLEGQGVQTPEFKSFLEGKGSSWGSIGQFLDSARQLDTHHTEAQARAADTKALVQEVFKALTGPMPDLAAAKARSGQLNQRLNEVHVQANTASAEDKRLLEGARLLLAQMVEQVGRPEEDAELFASLEIEDGAAGLRARVVKALEGASGGRSTWFQETVVVLAARTASAATDRDGRLNIVATAILAMVPRLPFRLRNFDRALQIAAEIL
ncbi:hypothetical protein EON82_16095 [bacterium]|nr:MAG: hypothetical protein EON82_16095 [bacterium]